MTVVDEGLRDSVRETEERLVRRYARDGVAPEDVRSAIADAVGRLSDARVRSFVPVLLERAVRRSLVV